MIQIIMVVFSLITLAFAEDIEIMETVLIRDNAQERYYFPSYSHDGQSIFFTSGNYVGLWSYDIITGEVIKLTDATGAGYDPVSLDDGTVIYRRDEYVNNLKYSSYVKMNPDTKKESLISGPDRFVSTVSLSDGRLFFLENNKLQSRDLKTGVTLTGRASDIILINDKLEIKLLKDGSLRTISPKGEGNYIWSKLSPQRDRILFTKTGEGTYICDLEGRILVDLGYAHAPQWSPDGKFIVYMRDYDDGVLFTESDIWISSADGANSWKVTDTSDRIEMYPQWSPDGIHVAYHTLGGNIYQTELRIVD